MDLLEDDETPKKKTKTERVAIATYVSPEDAAKFAMIRSKMGGKSTAYALRKMIRFCFEQVTKKNAA